MSIALACTTNAFHQTRTKLQDAKSQQAFQSAVGLAPTIIEVYSASGELDWLLHLVVRYIAGLKQVLMRRGLDNLASLVSQRPWLCAA